MLLSLANAVISTFAVKLPVLFMLISSTPLLLLSVVVTPAPVTLLTPVTSILIASVTACKLRVTVAVCSVEVFTILPLFTPSLKPVAVSVVVYLTFIVLVELPKSELYRA